MSGNQPPPPPPPPPSHRPPPPGARPPQATPPLYVPPTPSGSGDTAKYIAAALGGLLVAALIILVFVIVSGDDTNTSTTSSSTSSPPSSEVAQPTTTTSPEPTTQPVPVDPAPAPAPEPAPVAPLAGQGGTGSVESLPAGLLCKDVKARGHSYSAAVRYWELEGMPDRMDKDRNGVPCETVYPRSDVRARYGHVDSTYSYYGLPSGLLCRDLQARGIDVYGALTYYSWEGQPARMDANGDGVPCETVYPNAREVWLGYDD